MKNLKELTLNESKLLNGGFAIPEPWMGLPKSFFRDVIIDTNITKGSSSKNSNAYLKHFR